MSKDARQVTPGVTLGSSIAVVPNFRPRRTLQRELYVDAMSRFGQFVLGGSTAAPVEKKGVVAGFVDPNGAVGCG